MKRRLAAILLVLLAGAAAGRADAFPNDPYYAPYEWYGPLLGMPAAWTISPGSPSVTVAVLDSGVMADTPDLAGRLLAPLSATGSDPLDGTTNHHGTWVASIAGMGVNNGIGGAGVGNFSILPITVTNAAGGNMSDWIAAGIRMAADRGARAINVSLRTLSYSLLNDAAGYARGKGALVFVAGGNFNRRMGMTGYDNLIFVSGTNALDQRWVEGGEGSTWGPYIDLAAPADNIVAADPTLASGYGLGDGTSFAAPFAAGAAAMAWSINPLLAPDEVYAILKETAVDLGTPGWDEVFGWGRIDIGAVAERANRTAGAPEPATLGLLAAGLVLWGAGRRVNRPH